jgi:2-C-methyl-D-erythritol 4-phosphate cytidylyltransferase
VPVVDTIKQVNGGIVARSIDRQSLVAVQTPQAFRLDWLQQAYRVYDGSFEATDEAMLLEAAGFPVAVVAGDPANIKITTRIDLLIAEAILMDQSETD